MPWIHAEKSIRVGRSWTSSEGIVHPKNWNEVWSDDDKKSFGLTWKEPKVEKSFDSRFYHSADNAKSLKDVIETINGEEVTTVGLVNTWLGNIRGTAHEKLSPTDWCVIRELEGKGGIPSNIAQYRQEVRASCNKIEGLINGVKTVDELTALFDAPMKDGQPTGDAPINDWPEEI
tara:strand:+ start:1753 stop:2277 length:525 start_codon:yes stop_codon:yes gene_type:complete